jgi:hypothetical protein
MSVDDLALLIRTGMVEELSPGVYTLTRAGRIMMASQRALVKNATDMAMKPSYIKGKAG